MKIPGGFSLKKIVLYLDGNSLSLQRVGPVDRNELNELQELDKKGLAKFVIIDASTGFIAHKGMEQKLIDDLSSGDKVVSEVVDRSHKGHSLVQIYASNICLRKIKLTPEKYKQLVREEDLMLKGYTKPR